ncbi:prohibitin family protein [bacterium]|nr:prohibitin family protein [bacterium]
MGPFITMIAIVIGAIILGSYARKMSEGGFSQSELARMRNMVTGLVLLVVLAAFLGSSVVTVDVGKRMVLFNRFSKQFTAKPLEPGWTLVMPGVYERKVYDVQIQEYTMSATQGEGDRQQDDAITVRSSDGLEMDIDLTVLFSLDDKNLNELHYKIGSNYREKIIRPSVREAIRSVFALHEATAAYSTERESITQELGDRLEIVLADNNMLLNEVLVRNIKLPDAVTEKINEKKAAQQDAERMKYVLEKAEQEKQQVLIEASAQAEKIKVLNEALVQNPNYLKWLSIDKLNDDIKLVVTDGNTLLNLDALDRNGQ